MSEQVLSIEQMQHLQELGLNTNCASACWVKVTKVGGKDVKTCWGLSFCFVPNKLDNMEAETVPTFTLQDILELLPRQIIEEYASPLMIKCTPDLQVRFWYKDIYVTAEHEDFIDAAYEMLCWCIENKFLKGFRISNLANQKSTKKIRYENEPTDEKANG